MLPGPTFRISACLVALFAYGGLGVATTHAGDATYLQPDASHCDIFRVLSYDLPAECQDTAAAEQGLRTRSIKLHATQQAAAHSIAAATESSDLAATASSDLDVEATHDPADALSLAMRIQFQHDSDILTEEAKVSLDGIAVVLNNAIMVEKVIMLEGHADATGPDGYNLDLSLRRARAVQAYLVSEHEIENWRLPFTGKGETELYDQTAPTSPINRRVEFTNITG